MLARVGLRAFAFAAQNQYRHEGQACVQLSHKCGTADSRRMSARDDQGQAGGKLRLLDEAKRLSGITDPAYIGESLFQGRLAQRCLERIVVYQQDCQHVPHALRGLRKGRTARLVYYAGEMRKGLNRLPKLR